MYTSIALVVLMDIRPDITKISPGLVLAMLAVLKTHPGSLSCQVCLLPVRGTCPISGSKALKRQRAGGERGGLKALLQPGQRLKLHTSLASTAFICPGYCSIRVHPHSSSSIGTLHRQGRPPSLFFFSLPLKAAERC